MSWQACGFKLAGNGHDVADPSKGIIVGGLYQKRSLPKGWRRHASVACRSRPAVPILPFGKPVTDLGKKLDRMVAGEQPAS